VKNYLPIQIPSWFHFQNPISFHWEDETHCASKVAFQGCCCDTLAFYMHKRSRFFANWHWCFFLTIQVVLIINDQEWEKNVIEERTKTNFKFKRLGQTKTNTLMKTNAIMSLWPPSWMVMIICQHSPLTSHFWNCGSNFQ